MRYNIVTMIVLLLLTKNLLEARLQVPRNISEVFLLLQDLADQSLLALDVVVVKLLVDFLQHGDPLEHIHGVESPSLVAGPGSESRVKVNC